MNPYNIDELSALIRYCDRFEELKLTCRDHQGMPRSIFRTWVHVDEPGKEGPKIFSCDGDTEEESRQAVLSAIYKDNPELKLRFKLELAAEKYERLERKLQDITHLRDLLRSFLNLN